MIREGEGGLEPPVLAVGRGQALEKGQAKLLAIRPPREADGAAGLVDEQCIARELRHVLVDESEAARGLAADERGQRLHVLPLAPGGAGREIPRPADGRPRRRAVTPEEREERRPRVGQGEALVGRDGCGEALLGAGAVRELPVHPLLVALSGDGGRRGDGQSVAIGDGHFVILSTGSDGEVPSRAAAIRTTPACPPIESVAKAVRNSGPPKHTLVTIMSGRTY